MYKNYTETNKKYYNKEKALKLTKLYLKTNYVQRLLYSAKARAKKRGLEFTIEPKDIQLTDNCPYLGIPFTNIYGKGRIKTNLSLDRIDNTKGYIPGNVEVISLQANIMKNDASREELIAFAKTILKKYE